MMVALHFYDLQLHLSIIVWQQTVVMNEPRRQEKFIMFTSVSCHNSIQIAMSSLYFL